MCNLKNNPALADLIPDGQSLATVQYRDSIETAVDAMHGYDYSYLVVTDGDEVVRVVTSDAIMHAAVKNAGAERIGEIAREVKPHNCCALLSDAEDEIRDTGCAIIAKPDGQLGIITYTDYVAYFQQARRAT